MPPRFANLRTKFNMMRGRLVHGSNQSLPYEEEDDETLVMIDPR